MSPRTSWPFLQRGSNQLLLNAYFHCVALTLTSTNFPTETLLNSFITSFEGNRQTVPLPLYPTPLTCRVKPETLSPRVNNTLPPLSHHLFSGGPTPGTESYPRTRLQARGCPLHAVHSSENLTKRQALDIAETFLNGTFSSQGKLWLRKRSDSTEESLCSRTEGGKPSLREPDSR